MNAVLFGGTAVHCLISVKQMRRGTSGDVLSRELLADDRTGDFEAQGTTKSAESSRLLDSNRSVANHLDV